MQRAIDELTTEIYRNARATGTQIVYRALLTKGDGTGALIANATDRLIWVRRADDLTLHQVYLPPNPNIPFVDGDTTLETVEARVGYPPGVQGLGSEQVLDFFTKAGKLAIGNMSPMENLIYKAYYKQADDISTLRARPTSPASLAIFVDGPYLYRDPYGVWQSFSTASLTTDITTAVTALTGNNHQLGLVYLNKATNALALALSAASVYGGTLPSRASFSVTDGLNLANTLGSSAEIIGAVYLYDAQPVVAEADFYRSWPFRDLFGPVVTGGTLFTQTATATVTNTTTETTLLGSGVGSLTSYANSLIVGRSQRIRASGVLSTKATGAGTLNVKVKRGAVVLASTTAQTLTDNKSGVYWSLDLIVTCRSVGASGTIMAQGLFRVPGVPNEWPLTNGTSTVTIDTTANAALDVTATFDTADAANSISCTNVLVEVLN